jgi:hypothetical protein
MACPFRSHTKTQSIRAITKLLIELAAIIFHHGSGGGPLVATVVFGTPVLDGKGYLQT